MRPLRPTRKPSLSERWEARRKAKADKPMTYWQYVRKEHEDTLGLIAAIFAIVGLIGGGFLLLVSQTGAQSKRLHLPSWLLYFVIWPWFVLGVGMILGYWAVNAYTALTKDRQNYRKMISEEAEAA